MESEDKWPPHVTARAKKLKTRFTFNMNRIHGLMQLLSTNDALKQDEIFRSEGVRADLLRMVVVFLHATFEDMLRSQVPVNKRSFTFSGRSDLEKALTWMGIDPVPFRSLYPTLVQLAKRRQRIVHDADLPLNGATAVDIWGVVDDWQLIMWLLAVPAFFYELCMTLNPTDAEARIMYERHRVAMEQHHGFANQLIAIPCVRDTEMLEAWRRLSTTLEGIVTTLHPEGKGKKPDPAFRPS